MLLILVLYAVLRYNHFYELSIHVYRCISMYIDIGIICIYISRLVCTFHGIHKVLLVGFFIMWDHTIHIVLQFAFIYSMIYFYIYLHFINIYFIYFYNLSILIHRSNSFLLTNVWYYFIIQVDHILFIFLI